MKKFKNITLEISLKPFYSLEEEAIKEVCTRFFRQWNDLLEDAAMVSVLLWTSDGSEILEYTGDTEEKFEWARYIGGANPRMDWDRENDPKRINLHAIYYPYRENPIEPTYGDYKALIGYIKEIGRKETGREIRVGATFDPGPEFAKSEFKYIRHNEICIGESMGKSSMVCCYARLKAEDRAYAGFPEGIQEGTPFGTFFGRQARIFLQDMGFDYLWLSNGFGFGTETWGMIGATFDRNQFYEDRMEQVQKQIMEFWKLFREECNFPVETRGTNLTLGIDLASDAVNLKKIYEGGFDILPPCNSPWAAINGDYGMELAGYMSRMAHLPEEDYIYRFYVHDPWWMNSPWLDRYERQPHDIYLPLAVARINRDGEMVLPTHLNFLTIDNSLGELPDICPREIIPHIQEAMRTAPDEASPLVWVYPFDEYCDIEARRASKPFFEDMYIRGAINHGFSLSTVIAADYFEALLREGTLEVSGHIYVTPVPARGSRMNQVLCRFIKEGGKLMLYGSVSEAEECLLDLLNLRCESAISGICQVKSFLEEDGCEEEGADKVVIDPTLSDGGIDTLLKHESDPSTRVLAVLSSEDKERVAGIYRAMEAWMGGAVIWLRGNNSGRFLGKDANMTSYSEKEIYPTERFPRQAAGLFGFETIYSKKKQNSREPVVMLSRHENAFFYSGYSPDTTVRLKLRTPLGAPVLLGEETYLDRNRSVYQLPRAWHKECRVFVSQEDNGVISCRDIAPASYYMYRRIEVTGLVNAKVYAAPRTGYEGRTQILLNPRGPLVTGEELEIKLVDTPYGPMLELNNITGRIIISEQHVDFDREEAEYV
ncbi:hypothetical protein HNQ56_002371 [Anaerotaenia torta]|uniref:hypothetical protein n=1 Tax=Anaerotaenia torta TaxID=433293 RepID=UPI003D228DAE